MKIAFNIARAVVLLFSLFFLVMGFQWLVMPQNLANNFALLPNGILGWATIRADLGSFFLVTGITAAMAASNIRGANNFLACAAMLMAIAATGRLIGFALDGIPEGGFAPFIFELTVLTSLIGLASTRSRLATSEQSA
jgi:hypothetical protein